MSSVVIAGNTSGTITLDAPNVAGTTVLTLPTANGTILTTANAFSAGTGPAFSAYPSSNQSISQNVTTKVAFQSEEFDTNNCFDSSTNYRFTPTVAGYYQCTGCVTFTTSQGTTETVMYFYKNGSQFKVPSDMLAGMYAFGGSALIYLNGSTDYVEVYIYTNNASTRTISSNPNYTYFQAAMVRSA